jgi:predicted amidophosphoribosyltransferase
MNKKIITNVLYRDTYTESQTNKKIYERWLNVATIFTLKNPEIIKNKHILLVDDIITTGSTMAACTDTLLTISGVKVSIVSIATV